MRDKTIKTGIDVIGDTPWGTHLCLFYQTKEDLIDILVPYFKAGLENNEFCMWVTSEPLSAKDAKRSLQKAVRNLDAYIVKGQIEILDYSQWYTKSGKLEADRVLQGWIEKENQAVKRGFDGLRLTGNTFWLEQRDWAAFTEYEATVDQVVGNYRMLAICTYSLDRCGAAEVMDVVSNHQFALVKREGKWEAIESAERKRAEEAERLQRDQLIAHSRILRFILSTQELDELLGLILDEALGLLRVEFGSIHLLQKDGLVLRCWRDFSDELCAHMHFFPATDLPNWTRQPCIVHERLSEHGIIPDFAKRDGIQAWASIPLHLQSPRNVEEGEWLGTVLVGSRHYEALNKEEVRMFQGLADQLALAIDHARAYRAAHERLARLQILRTIDSAIIQGQDTRVVLRHVVDMIPQGLVADAVAISMLGEEHFRTEVFVMRLPGGVFVEEEAFTLADSLLHWFVERQEPVIIYDLFQDPRVQMHRQRNCIDRLISYLGVPLVVRGRTIGILHILTTQPRIFVDEDIAFFRTMAGQAAIAIANARLFEEIQQELTERKRAEEALRKSEEKYRGLVENLSDVIFEIDSQGMVKYISPVISRTLGYAAEEVIGKHFIGFVSEEDRKLLSERFSELQKGVVGNLEYRLISKSGDVRWVRTSTNPMFEGNEFKGGQGTLIDITERKRAEEKLRESEEQFRGLVEAAPDVVYTISAEDGSLSSLNPAFETITGWSRAEWLGKPFMGIVHPDDRSAAVETYQKASRGEAPLPYELRILSKSGEYLVGEFTSTPHVKGGKVVGELGIARDITERKRAEKALRQAEEKYRSIVENAVEGIYQSTPDGAFLSTNPALAAMYGYDTPKEFVAAIQDIGHQVYVDPNRRAVFKQLVQIQGGVRDFENQTYRKDGRVIWTSENARIVRDEDGKILYYEGFVEDITERKRAEEEIKNLAKFPSENPFPVLRLSQDGTLLYANEASQVLLRDWRCTLGSYVPSFWRHVVTDALTSQSRRTIDVELGEQTHSFVIAPVLDAGYVNLYGRDITERKRAEDALRQSEERLRLITDNMLDMVSQVNMEGIHVYVSPAHTRVLGYQPEELLDKSIYAFLHPQDVEPVTAAIQAWLQSGSTGRAEFRYRHADGHYVWLETAGSLLFDDNGSSIGAILSGRDISERKRAEEELKTAKSRLQHLSHRLLEVQENDRRAIARELHDEIGQILTAAKIDLQIVRRGKIPEDLAARLDENVASLDNCLSRVRNLSLDLRPSMLDDLGLVAALHWQLNRQAERAGFQVHLVAEEASERLRPELETTCYRIVQEALTNIAKHAHAHNVRVELTSSDREVLLSVRDDGVGFHVESALAGAAHGVSFGILGMQERASLLGGKLEIVSAREKGTTVTARFPLR